MALLRDAKKMIKIIENGTLIENISLEDMQDLFHSLQDNGSKASIFEVIGECTIDYQAFGWVLLAVHATKGGCLYLIAKDGI